MSTTYEVSIGEILSSNKRQRLIVPQFQRGYEWKVDHVTAFWRDILEFKSQRGLKDGPKKHFFGPIVLLEKGEDFQVLDGQQRLATTTILLSVIRDASETILIQEASNFARDTQNNLILKATGETALELSETDASFFKAFIQDSPRSKTPARIRTHRKIEAAQKFLSGKVREAIGTSTPQASLSFLKELRQIIVSDLTVACIPVTSERDAFKIFETLNDRGLKLASPDLLLNLLMQRSGEVDRKTIRRLWTEMIEGLGKFDLKDFLRHFWISKHGDVKSSDLYTVLREHIEGHQIDPLTFVKECSEECDSYISIVSIDKPFLGQPLATFIACSWTLATMRPFRCCWRDTVGFRLTASRNSARGCWFL